MFDSANEARSGISGRRLALLYVAIVLCGIAAIVAYGWTPFWSFLRIPAPSPAFADLRSIQAGLAASTQGLNPQISNPTDPWGRVMNYPSIWIGIARLLSLDAERNFLAFASVEVLAFVAACGWLIWRFRSVYVLLGSLSSAAALGIERGNTDLLIFVLMAAFAFCGRAASILAFLAATALKIYPVVALHAALIGRKIGDVAIMAAGAVAILAYLLPVLPAIDAGNPASGRIAYGRFLFAEVIERFPHNRVLLYGGAAALALLALALSAKYRSSLARFAALAPAEARFVEIEHVFVLGASIYFYTFMMANNYDYRLIFLLFCMPYLATRIGWVGHATNVLILVAMNYGAIDIVLGKATALVTAPAKLAVFAIVSVLLARQSWAFARSIPIRSRV